MPETTALYFDTPAFDNRRSKKSMNGTPINIIHGTKEMVRIKVLWYRGSGDNCCPKRNRKSVIEGYITIQILSDMKSLAFVFIIVKF